MDYLLTGIVLIALFFSLRTNYKLSSFEEKQEKNNQRLKDEVTKSLSKISMNIESMEKKLIFFQKSLNDFKESQDITSIKNLNAIQKQLLALKSDTDLLKTIYLKPERKVGEKNDQLKTQETENISIAEEKSPKESDSILQNENYLDAFKAKVKTKLENMSGDEIWILKELLGREPLKWQNISELEDDVSMLKFKIPKLSRQFIIDGLPVLMIKHVGDKMFVKWGEGLTTDKIEDIQSEIRGDL